MDEPLQRVMTLEADSGIGYDFEKAIKLATWWENIGYSKAAAANPERWALEAAYKDHIEQYADGDIILYYNNNSGYTFASAEYGGECVMLDSDGDAHLHVFTPYDGHEGFLQEVLDETEPAELRRDDLEYLARLAGEFYAFADVLGIPEKWRGLAKAAEDDGQALDDALGEVELLKEARFARPRT